VQHISDLYPKFTLRPHHVWKYGRHPICDDNFFLPLLDGTLAPIKLNKNKNKTLIPNTNPNANPTDPTKPYHLTVLSKHIKIVLMIVTTHSIGTS